MLCYTLSHILVCFSLGKLLLYSVTLLHPNRAHLLNKCQINMGLSHFHEFVILSGMYTLAPYQIDSVKRCGFCNVILILYRFFLPTHHDFGR